MSTPRYTVVVPLYNGAATVERTLAAIAAQTVSDFEVVVVDDGSSDDTAAVVRAWADPRVRLLQQENAGVSAARNTGLREARADWIAFCDADDTWDPAFLATIEHLHRDFPEARVCATAYRHSFPDGEQEAIMLRGLQPDWRGILPYFQVAANSHPPIHPSAVAIARSALQEIGGFPLGVRAGEDLLTWARLAIRHPVAYDVKARATFAQVTTDSLFVRRPPDEPDPVGPELAKLLGVAREAQRPALRRYLSLWHRMRLDLYLRLAQRRLAFREWCRAMRYAPVDRRLWAYGAFLLLPLRGPLSGVEYLARRREVARRAEEA